MDLPVILSTGLLDLTDINKTVEFLKSLVERFDRKKPALLHSSYPVPRSKPSCNKNLNRKNQSDWLLDHVIGNDAHHFSGTGTEL